MRYLTVQDILWIHLQLGGTNDAYRFADLEEATFYQYAYGDSRSVQDQAARLLWGFTKKAPLATHNAEVALLATKGFLIANGFKLTAKFSASASDSLAAAKEAIHGASEPDPHAHTAEVRTILGDLLATAAMA